MTEVIIGAVGVLLGWLFSEASHRRAAEDYATRKSAEPLNHGKLYTLPHASSGNPPTPKEPA